ncbi:MAG: hypothetical protein MUF83_01530 [Acidimicrobiales bacterium]|nr:hypothetical protein [Acidimicrobiales bacterium]
MTQLVAYYDTNPVEVNGDVEITQAQIASAAGVPSVEGAIRAALVYVCVYRPTGWLLVPFGGYDDWSLRDRYNEALRIMTVLGASSITCETFAEVSVRRGLRAKIAGKGPQFTQERVQNSGFDFRHDGTGHAPRDPRPLSWPDEPGFSAAVANVLENGSAEVEIRIRSSRMYAIDGDLALQLKGVGFELGGVAQRSGTTILHIRASFPQVRKGWMPSANW